MKICKNCKHYKPMWKECGTKQAQTIHPVTGTVSYTSAWSMRVVGGCGAEARYYEPKTKRTFMQRVRSLFNT